MIRDGAEVFIHEDQGGGRGGERAKIIGYIICVTLASKSERTMRIIFRWRA